MTALFHNIPQEMRTYAQFVCWQYAEKDGKKTKIPISPHTSRAASVSDPSTWGTFEQAVQAAHDNAGIGFVLTENDPFCCVDLDDSNGNQGEQERQIQIFEELNSFSERSPSGNGLHIWVKGLVPSGKRKGKIEVYSSQRFMTLTGDVYRNAPIQERQEQIQNLWASMSGEVAANEVHESTAQTTSDEELVARATAAANGQKFAALYSGNWKDYYPSQSEADLAFINIVAFYSQNKNQIKRIFHNSGLGQRGKAKQKGYVDNMINKALDRTLSPIDFTALKRQVANELGLLKEIKPLSFRNISNGEWNYSRLHPECIVDNYLYADVSLLIAPGGIGKTTLVIYEAIHITLNLSLYGRTVKKPGQVVILTAEDSREQIIARLFRIAMSMKLSLEQIEHVKNNVLIEYVGGDDFRLCNVVGDVVTTSPNVDKLIDAIKPLIPSILIIDPAVSFGVGESRVNDAEQGLVRAARRIRDAVGCCVRLVHHSGKQNAREGAVDQYAGRGGSAMPDGARMVAVLKRLDAKEWQNSTGEILPDGADGLLLALPKLSYAPAQPHIYLERHGFYYRHVVPTVQNPEDRRSAIDNLIIEFLRDEEPHGRFHSKASLEQCEALGITRNETRAAIARLEVAGRI